MSRKKTDRVPTLLCNGTFYGTLAAARALGGEGIPVTVADPSPTAPALWSRHVTRRLRCPPLEDVERFSEWLRRFAEREPRHVLYATSDELSFTLALHREALSERFALYQPDVDVIMRVLDKGLLGEHARAAGLDVPDTWLPQNEADVTRAAREADGPLMVKPRTQVAFGVHSKGMLAPRGVDGLRAAYARFTSGEHVHDGDFARRFPEATRPMLQRYYPEAADGIYSLAGFRDHTGAHFVALGARKILQRPRRLGVGLCFEAAPVDPQLAAGVARLCERVGYYGVFETEFIQVGGRSLLIDMNPRFYGQLAFEVARGLPLPQLAYAAALGDDDEVARLVAQVPPPGAGTDLAYCNRFGLGVQLGAQRLFGSAARGDAAHWSSWLDAHEGRLVDAVADPTDAKPYAIAIAGQIYSHLRHPGVFIRHIALDR
jgi:predicted ATP-grasp superfamily ATP-dependent carboligase